MGKRGTRAVASLHPPEDIEDLVAETQRLLDSDQLAEQTREAIGTKQVLAHIAGDCTRDEAMERVKIDTRRFAKAQRTWLKRYRGVHWIPADDLSPKQIAQNAISAIDAQSQS